MARLQGYEGHEIRSSWAEHAAVPQRLRRRLGCGSNCVVAMPMRFWRTAGTHLAVQEDRRVGLGEQVSTGIVQPAKPHAVGCGRDAIILRSECCSNSLSTLQAVCAPRECGQVS